MQQPKFTSNFKQVLGLQVAPSTSRIIMVQFKLRTNEVRQKGDVSLQLKENVPARIAVTVTTFSLNNGADSQKTESPTTVYKDQKIPQCLEKTSSTQKANQQLSLEGVESNDAIKRNKPVAMQTRHTTKLQHPSKTKRAKNVSG